MTQATLATAIGLLAAFCTTFAFVPQVWRTLKTRDTQAISLWMYSIFTSGVLLWLIYGIFIQAWPVIIANSLTFLLALTVLLLKIRHG